MFATLYAALMLLILLRYAFMPCQANIQYITTLLITIAAYFDAVAMPLLRCQHTFFDAASCLSRYAELFSLFFSLRAFCCHRCLRLMITFLSLPFFAYVTFDIAFATLRIIAADIC